MKDFKPVNNNEKDTIMKILHEATTHAGSADFLSGFPWGSTDWFSANLEDCDLENLYLFWDGLAWGERSNPRRRLSKGLKNFIELVKQSLDQRNEHLKKIIKIKETLPKDRQLFLILVGKDKSGPFMILDGNHRAVAVMWHAHESGLRTGLPTHAWIGLSPEMPRFCKI